MKRLSRGVAPFAFCLLAMLSACTNQAPEVQGVLSLPLQASTASGNVYRLRNATFQITGAASQTLSSEASPSTATALLSTLPIGSYSIQLLPGWTLVRLTGAGEQAVSAQLVSSSTMPFSIQSQQLTPVTFTFETDGTLVMLGEGTLGVNIAVNERDGGAGGSFTLNVNLVGSGAVSSGAALPGISCTPSPTTADCSESFPSGTVVTLTASVSAAGGTVQWSGDCVATGSLTASVVMSASRTCTATFSGPTTPTNFTLNVNLVGSGTVSSGAALPGISCTPSPTTADCSESFPSGTVVTLTASVSAAGGTVQWSGDCVATGSLTASVVMSANRTCTATFSGPTTPTNFTLNVNLVGSGTVSSGAALPGISCTPSPTTADCSESFPSGTVVTLTASVSAAGGTVQWSGDCVATGSLTASVVMSANRICTATFSPTTTPAFFAAGAGTAGTGDLVVSYPASVSAGQLLVLQLGTRSANVPTTPAGWTQFSSDEMMNTRQRLYFKTATASEPASLSVAFGASEVNIGRMYAFSGVRATSFTESSTLVTDIDGTLPGPTVTVAGAGRLVVAFVALDNLRPMEPFTGASGGTWSEPVSEFGSDLGLNFSLQLQVASLTTSSTISGGTGNFGGGSDASVCRAFALIGS